MSFGFGEQILKSYMFIFQEVEIAIQDVKQEEPIVNVKMEEDGSDDAEVEVVVKKPRRNLMESLLYDDDDDVEITDFYRRTSKERAEEEVKKYREMPKHKDALAFWNHHKYTLPHLAKLAATYLVAQATSVAAERVFSTSGDILSAERSCLNMDSLDAMIFLKKNASKQSEFLR